MGKPIAPNFPTAREQLEPLHVAVICNDIPAVKDLLQNGADIDVRTRSGATPLMLACLFGRRRLISFLLIKQASYKAKDRRGNKAWAYFTPDRHILAKFRGRQFKDILSSSSAARQRIRRRAFCADEALRSAANSRSHPQSDCVFLPEPEKGRLSLWQLVSSVDINPKLHLDKTRGCISGRDVPRPFVFAISGWGDTGNAGLLSNSVYTDKVIALCEELGIGLTYVKYNERTQETDEGRGSACHVEKQLAVYWLEEALKFTGREHLTKENLASLKEATLPPHRRHAFIFLDHKPCRDCWEFLAALRHESGIEFTAICRPFVKHAQRKQQAFLKSNEIPTATGSRQKRPDEPDSPHVTDDEQGQGESTDGDDMRDDDGLDDDDEPETFSSRNADVRSAMGSPGERQDDLEQVSHGVDVESCISMEHKRDTPSPVTSYVQQSTPDPDRSYYFATPSPRRTQPPMSWYKGKPPTKNDPTSRETAALVHHGSARLNNRKYYAGNLFSSKVSSELRSNAPDATGKEDTEPLSTATSNPRPSDLKKSVAVETKEGINTHKIIDPALQARKMIKDDARQHHEVVTLSDDDSDSSFGLSPSPAAMKAAPTQGPSHTDRHPSRAQSPKSRRLPEPSRLRTSGSARRRLFGHADRNGKETRTRSASRDPSPTQKADTSTNLGRTAGKDVPAATRPFPDLSGFVYGQ